LQPAQLLEQLDRVIVGFLLQALHKLQASHESKTFRLNFRRPWPASMLRIKATDPRLMKLRGFSQKPLRRERFAVGLHVVIQKIPYLRTLPGGGCGVVARPLFLEVDASDLAE
jgi:hypothetical protein